MQCKLDELFILREACLVKPFKNKALVPEPPNLQQESFDLNAEPVEQFGQRPLSDDQMQQRFIYELLSGLKDAKIGQYSRFHENAIIRYGYNHAETVRMAYMYVPV
jgi:hypothetical protein